MDFSNLLDTELSFRKSTTVINCSINDGLFAFHYLLSHRIKNISKQEKIVVISFSQTLSHYKSIQAKLGNLKNLTELQNDQRFLFIESFGIGKYENNLYEELNKIVEKISNFTNKDDQVNIFIEDLSLLPIIGLDEKLLFCFLKKLSCLNNSNVSLKLFLHKFDFNDHLSNEINMTADVLIKIEKLSTGYLKDINGKVSISKFEINDVFKSDQYLYKISDKNVTFQSLSKS